MILWPLLLIVGGRGASFNFFDDDVIRPFMGRPPARGNVTIALECTAAYTPERRMYIGEQYLPILNGDPLCLHEGAPVWRFFKEACLSGAHGRFGQGGPPEEAVACDAGSTYACARGDYMAFSTGDTLRVPQATLHQWREVENKFIGKLDPGFTYHTDFVEHVGVDPGGLFILPRPPHYDVCVYGGRHMTATPGGGYRVFLTLAAVFQVILYTFFVTHGQNPPPLLGVAASVVVLIWDPSVPRVVSIVPVWLSGNGAPLILHSLWTTLAVLHAGEWTFSLVLVASVMLLRSSRDLFDARAIDVVIWGFNLYLAYMASHSWCEHTMYSVYGLSAGFMAGVWVLVLVFYSIAIAAGAHTNEEFRSLIRLFGRA